MTTTQMRNVPGETSRALKAKAASEGRSLSDYLLRELECIASRPSRAELLERIARRGITDLPPRRQRFWRRNDRRGDARHRCLRSRRDTARHLSRGPRCGVNSVITH